MHLMIKKLKLVNIKPKKVITPQCQAPADSDSSRYKQWRLDRYKKLRPDYDPLKCQRASTVAINDQPYCRCHAGQLALRWWLSGKLIDK